MTQVAEWSSITIDDWKIIKGNFEMAIKSSDSVSESDTSEYNMNAIYKTNHSCIWNLPSNVGQKCHIMAKDDKYAFIIFNNTALNVSDILNMYRLEDLTKVE